MRLNAGTPFLLILAALLSANISALQQGAPSERGSAAIVDQAWEIIHQRFVDPTFNSHDWLETRHALPQSYASSQEARAAITRMLAQLGDPLTRFMDAAELASTTQELQGKVGSIGVADPWTVRDTTTGGLKFLHFVAASPAFEAGLHPGDILEAIESTPAARLSRDEAFRRLRGKAGTAVRLTVRRGPHVFRVSVLREPITLHTVRAFASNEHGRVLGYIGLSQFAVKSSDEVRDALTDLLRRQATALILDLRNNPGGFVPASREIATLFLGAKPLYYSVDRSGTAKEFTGSGSPRTLVPLVVLINEATASAAEMLAGALQDNHRGALVGTRTFGQGYVHAVQPLADGSAVVLAIARFRMPAGREVWHGGLEPDYRIEMPEQNLQPSQIARSKDAQYQKAAALLLKNKVT